jgi:hypothetical protein
LPGVYSLQSPREPVLARCLSTLHMKLVFTLATN